jgi:hypothetical protein
VGADAVEVVRCGGDGESESEDKTAGSRFEIRGLGDGSETQRFQPRTQRTDPSSVCEGSKSGWMCMALGIKKSELVERRVDLAGIE